DDCSSFRAHFGPTCVRAAAQLFFATARADLSARTTHHHAEDGNKALSLCVLRTYCPRLCSGFQTCWANRLEGYVLLIDETELRLLVRKQLRRRVPKRNRRLKTDRFSRDSLGCE